MYIFKKQHIKGEEEKNDHKTYTREPNERKVPDTQLKVKKRTMALSCSPLTAQHLKVCLY